MRSWAMCAHLCSDGIVSWIKKKTGPIAITVDSADKLTELEAENPVLIVAYYKELKVRLPRSGT